LGEAIARLQQDKGLLEMLKPGLAEALFAVRTAEWEAMRQFTLEEV
jgi:hypothetical protein